MKKLSKRRVSWERKLVQLSFYERLIFLPFLFHDFLTALFLRFTLK